MCPNMGVPRTFRLTRANIEEEADRFAAALASDSSSPKTSRLYE
jgi:hypothetical protein